MAEKERRSVLQMLKDQIAKSGKTRSDSFWLKAGKRARIRFLSDFGDAIPVKFHDRYGEDSFITPCLSYFGKKCPYCDMNLEDDGVRHTDNFIWTIWNYETQKRELFIFKANRCSPLGAMQAMYEELGSLTGCDFVIRREGEKTETTYTLIPGQATSFKGKGKDARPFSEKQVFDMLKKIYGITDNADDDEEEANERPHHSKINAGKKRRKPKPEAEDDEADEDEDEDDEDDLDDDDEDEDEDLDDEEDEDEDDEDDDVAPRKKAKAKARTHHYEDEEEEEDDDDGEARRTRHTRRTNRHRR